MAKASATRACNKRAQRARWAGCWSGVLAATLGCAEVLGIPTDPELVSLPPVVDKPAALPDAPEQTPPSEPPPATGLDPSSSDGVLPPGRVSGIEGSGSAPGGAARPVEPPAPGPSEPAPDAGVDAGAPSPVDAGAPAPAPEDCQPGRQPVDVVLIVDNTATMAATNAELEEGLPGLAAQLDELLVDHRIILLSRHRDAERGSSEAADSSLCIAAPLGGAEACPSAAPALAPRFFHYAVPIGATDSFSRALAAIGEPDPFGLTSIGWSEWLRLGARKVIVEITDTDTALAGEELASGLASAAPEHFATDDGTPAFVFHAIVGMQQKALALDVYQADEPIQTEVCSGAGSSPGNAGERYQALSRATGGLRQSVCPAAAMPLRLGVLAADIAARSVVACP